MSLLPFVTTAPYRLPEHEVYVLSDAFTGLADLAGAATVIGESGRRRGTERIFECLQGEGQGEEGDATATGVVNFWREEWVLE